jgi:[NiFe] hydrogenase assembly HybE family chaperone
MSSVNPAAAIAQRFREIERTQMRGVPLLNPALRVQAVGFRPWSHHWLGVLVTPWFMNLLLCARERAHWQRLGERETRHYVFPAGVFEFIGHHDAVLGDYQACSLFSPMAEFTSAKAAHDTAAAALDALFDASIAQRPDSTRPSASSAA